MPRDVRSPCYRKFRRRAPLGCLWHFCSVYLLFYTLENFLLSILHFPRVFFTYHSHTYKQLCMQILYILALSYCQRVYLVKWFVCLFFLKFAANCSTFELLVENYCFISPKTLRGSFMKRLILLYSCAGQTWSYRHINSWPVSIKKFQS